MRNETGSLRQDSEGVFWFGAECLKALNKAIVCDWGTISLLRLAGTTLTLPNRMLQSVSILESNWESSGNKRSLIYT